MKLPPIKLPAAGVATKLATELRPTAAAAKLAVEQLKGAATPSLAAISEGAKADGKLADLLQGSGPAKDAPANAQAMAARQAANGLFDAKPALPDQLNVAAPGSARGPVKGSLPKLEWPTTLGAALDALKAKGFSVVRSDSEATVLRSPDGAQVTSVVPFQLAGLDGYVAHGQGDLHVQLGELTFSKDDWAAFTEGYEDAMRTYNSILKRPNVLERSPAPRDGSPLHGPQDGLKHFLRLGLPLEELSEARANAQELIAAQSKVIKAMRQAEAAGLLPSHFVRANEGLDGASKTGNGLTQSRIDEKVGYDVKTKAFRKPEPEDRPDLGPIWRYAEFADPKKVTQPTSWFLDRAWPGDGIFNPATTFEEVVAGANAFEKDLKAQDVLVVKMLFKPTTEASMRTFGKRLARAAIAEDLLARRTDLTAEEVESLRGAAALKPGFGDFRSVTVAHEVQAKYEAFCAENSEHFPWTIIDTSDRHEGRLDALTAFRWQLRKYVRAKRAEQQSAAAQAQ